MSNKAKIPGTTEAWESGALGRDEEHAKRVKIDSSEIDDALELKAVSIRLQKSLIEDFKFIAKVNGIGYQTLIRQMLTRFALSEKKRIINAAIAEKNKEDKEIDEIEGKDNSGKHIA